MLGLQCSEGGNVKTVWGEIARAPYLARVICEFDAIFVVNLGKFDYRVKSFAFLRIAAALRLEIIHKECPDSKTTWKMI